MADLHDPRGRRRAAAPRGLLLTDAARVQAARPQAEWSHHCSACGKCCNSPPELSVSELFQHQDTFFGCLSVQRLRRPRADEATREAFDALAAELWHRLAGAPPSTDDVLLATRGFDLGVSERCPALDDEQRCSLHEHGKPAICRVVPLDALSPDRAQHLVLASREADARFFGSDCIEPGVRPGFEIVTRRLSVVDPRAQQAIAQRRRDLAAERQLWGNAVFELLRSELFASSAALERVPARGFLTLSLAPVLLVMAGRSTALRRRCCSYLEAQAKLAERLLRDAAQRDFAERGSVRQLDALARTNARLLLQIEG